VGGRGSSSSALFWPLRGGGGTLQAGAGGREHLMLLLDSSSAARPLLLHCLVYSTVSHFPRPLCTVLYVCVVSFTVSWTTGTFHPFLYLTFYGGALRFTLKSAPAEIQKTRGVAAFLFFFLLLLFTRSYISNMPVAPINVTFTCA
jgi:hypothetical protein